MTSEQGDDASVANAANWLRLIFHSLTCNNPACVLDDRCSGGKALLSHVLTCSNPGACAVPSCTSVRRLTLHWLRCQDTQCRLCAGVWRDLSGSDGRHEQHQQFQPRARYNEPLPPEAPGTPDRNGAAPIADVFSDRQPVANPGEEGVAPSGRGADDEDMQVVDVDFDPLLPVADRAVVQLQGGYDSSSLTHSLATAAHSLTRELTHELSEPGPAFRFPAGVPERVSLPGHDARCDLRSSEMAAGGPGHPDPSISHVVLYIMYCVLQEATSYMRYLLHCLMCRNERASPSRAPGLQFWLDALMPQGLMPHDGSAAPPPLAVAAAVAPTIAGRRLLGHRLMCRNSFCALCSGTCDLFTRGRALHGQPPVPSGLHDMDLIVHELSLALGSVNL
ncbi:hypothetical protein PLESTB_001432300 [Pleodorina starrii]|uniref:TAZ-type domain-containing protein n=1 Tax=Pleodorina starrii TaxID=330485 RepID=A0A9W6F763_9CHLO|nr:hypothetical protein PLESTB_001432300 [Pleodorina starrii]